MDSLQAQSVSMERKRGSEGRLRTQGTSTRNGTKIASWHSSNTPSACGGVVYLHNPTHPGEVIKELCLDPLDLSFTEASKALGVRRKTLSAVLNGRAGIRPEMVIRLSIAFDTLSESWLMQQIQYDLWHAEQHRNELHVKKLVAA